MDEPSAVHDAFDELASALVVHFDHRNRLVHREVLPDVMFHLVMTWPAYRLVPQPLKEVEACDVNHHVMVSYDSMAVTAVAYDDDDDDEDALKVVAVVVLVTPFVLSDYPTYNMDQKLVVATVHRLAFHVETSVVPVRTLWEMDRAQERHQVAYLYIYVYVSMYFPFLTLFSTPFLKVWQTSQVVAVAEATSASESVVDASSFDSSRLQAK